MHRLSTETVVAIISCWRRVSGRSGDISDAERGEGVVQRVGDERVRADDARQFAPDMSSAPATGAPYSAGYRPCCALSSPQKPLVGLRRGDGLDPGHRAIPHRKKTGSYFIVSLPPKPVKPPLAASGIIIPMTSPLLEGLNEPQRQAVLHENGPVLIFAGAGSGKTNALTKRIAYLIREREVRPYNILAVTFTNKAAAEMKERIARLVGDLAMRDLWAGTFHSLCARVLRERGGLIGLDKNFVIYDDGDQLALIKEAMRELDLDEKQFAPRAVLSQISKDKETLQTPADIKNDFTAIPVRARRRQCLQLVSGKADPLQCTGLRRPDHEVRATAAGKRAGPRALPEALSVRPLRRVPGRQRQPVPAADAVRGKHKNICVVGDDDQSIYAFRGRQRPDHPQLRARLPRRHHHQAGTELPLAPRRSSTPPTMSSRTTGDGRTNGCGRTISRARTSP